MEYPRRHPRDFHGQHPLTLQTRSKNPEAATAAKVDSWFRTGDIGMVDEDGFVSIVDRKKENIR